MGFFLKGEYKIILDQNEAFCRQIYLQYNLTALSKPYH